MAGAFFFPFDFGRFSYVTVGVDCIVVRFL
jgi:hypothetical protein